MLVLIQIISVITYSLSIANVAKSRKNKYILWDFASIVKNGIVSFDHDNSFKNNFTTTLRHARNNYFQRKFTECSNNSRHTWKTLNRLIRYKNTSKDVILNHGGSTQSTVSNPPAIAEVFNNYIFFKRSLQSWSQYSSSKYISIQFPGSTCGKFIFLRSLW